MALCCTPAVPDTYPHASSPIVPELIPHDCGTLDMTAAKLTPLRALCACRCFTELPLLSEEDQTFRMERNRIRALALRAEKDNTQQA